MKEILYRGGLVRFSIPGHWVEEYEPDGGGMFYDDGPDTGTLRLNVITARAPDAVGPDMAYDLVRSASSATPSSARRLPDGNAMTSWVQRTVENGEPITLFWWQVASPVPPRHMRIATWSYTVRTANEHTERTVEDVDILGDAIAGARFHPVLVE